MRDPEEFLISPTLPITESYRRIRLLHLIEEYFGEEDARLVLEIAAYFKYPNKYRELYEEIVKKLKEAER